MEEDGLAICTDRNEKSQAKTMIFIRHTVWNKYSVDYDSEGGRIDSMCERGRNQLQVV